MEISPSTYFTGSKLERGFLHQVATLESIKSLLLMNVSGSIRNKSQAGTDFQRINLSLKL
jgi:hypothetical protein